MQQFDELQNFKVQKITDVSQLGAIIRAYRKHQRLTLTQVSGLTRLGVRFLSELERGKPTVELGKALYVINALGLDITLQPRRIKTHYQGE